MEALRNHNKAYINHLTYIDLQNTKNHEQTCKLRGRKIPQALVNINFYFLHLYLHRYL